MVESQVKVVEWNPGEEMSKEYAMTMIDEMSCFFRKLYHFPIAKTFSGEADYIGRLQELDGLKEFIRKNVRE